tara:strand:- start:9479 stop:9793 length:315 start_codon:yes stop_codon:yes gene_type:complete
MADIWMTSEGLDVDFEEDLQKKDILVCYGELEGSFVSMGSEHNRLVFKTKDIETAIKYMSNFPDYATVSYNSIVYKFSWKNHNYKVEKYSKDTMIITVENNNEE